jgi:hypothetical protein
MLRDADRGSLSTRAANAAWYCTIPDDISSRMMATAKMATDGDQAQSANVRAASTEPIVMTVAAPILSICRPT